MSFVRSLRTATTVSRTLAARPALPLRAALRTPALSQTRTMASANTFLEAIKKRRTYYALSNKSTVPDSRIEEIVKEIVLHVPSSFNSQSSRVEFRPWRIRVLILKYWSVTRMRPSNSARTVTDVSQNELPRKAHYVLPRFSTLKHSLAFRA